MDLFIRIDDNPALKGKDPDLKKHGRHILGAHRSPEAVLLVIRKPDQLEAQLIDPAVEAGRVLMRKQRFAMKEINGLRQKFQPLVVIRTLEQRCYEHIEVEIIREVILRYF